MAKQFPAIDDRHRDFILRQRIFFVASAAAGSRVNVSPRSTDSLRLLGSNAVAYLDRTGSGNETAAHVRAGGRVTIMLCAFAGPPLIVRLFGRGIVHRLGSASYQALLADHFGGSAPLGTRQIVALEVETVQTSCGYGVPLFECEGERGAMDKWAQSKGEAALLDYRREHNVHSIDGLPTGLFEPEETPA